MNVLCNLYPVGITAHGTRTRSGIYRVVENLVLGLAGSELGQCFFHANEHFWSSYGFYLEHLRGPRNHWAASRWQVRFSRHLAKLECLVSEATPQTDLRSRFARRVAAFYLRRWRPWISRVSAGQLAEIDVYHSPFLPVPEWVKGYPHIRRFTTIYDVIPLTNPEFFSADGNIPALLRRVVDGLGPEDWVLCISQATRSALLEHNSRLDPAKVSVTHLAAAPCFYPERREARLAEARARYGVPAGGDYFLSVCTLEPRKNLEGVIRAFARLRRDGELPATTCLVLVGNVGWRTEEIFRALEEAAGCREAIVLAGYVPDEDLAALYSGALAFVYPSRAEGFGLPPLEAMQCGTPVITSNVSSLPEVVADAGLLVDPEDGAALGAAMRSLHRDGDLRRDLAARGLARAATFSWERFTAETFAAYRRAMATGAGSDHAAGKA